MKNGGVKGKKIMSYLPLIMVELYLVMTLLLMTFGPIKYNLQNREKFWVLIVLYHVALIVGYVIVAKVKSKENDKGLNISENTIKKIYWIILAVGFLVWCVVYRNGTHAKSYIPYELPKHFIQGLLHPAQRYYWKLTPEALAQFHGNKLVTGISSIFYPLYYFMPMFLIGMWNHITKTQKVLSYVQMFLTMAMGISVGTNKYLFDLLFIVAGGFVIELFCRWNEEGFSFIKKRKIVLFTIIFLAIFDVCYFTYNLRDRTGNLSAYIGSISEDITVEDGMSEAEQMESAIAAKRTGGFLIDMLVGVENYICQGYYGFSLALDEEFTTTYGVGHSAFCISTLEGLFDIELQERTFQEKISDVWSSKSRWHSFYSQMANDVGFYGVIGVMFVIGVLLAAAWQDAYKDQNIVAKCLLVLFVIMVLYMPANNQVGNGAGTFFAFWETMVLWIFLKWRKKSHDKNKV